MLSVTSPRNSSDPRRFPRPVRGCLNKNPVAVKEVEGGGVGEFRNNEGTLKSSNLGLSVILGGLRIGGVNVIIMVVAGAVEDGLKVGGERHRRRREREKEDEEKEQTGGSHL